MLEHMQWWMEGDAPALRLLPHAFASTPFRRWVYVSTEVALALLGPWKSIRDEVRLSRARADVDTFTSNALMSARLPPSKSVLAQLALLEPGVSEICEIRSRDPKPGVRRFGSFAARNHFVALTYAFRENLETDEDWIRETERYKLAWRTLFPTYHPFSGTSVDDYATNLFLV